MTETDLFSPVVEIEAEVAPPARTETANVDAPVLASMTLPTPEATVLHAAPKDDTPSPETVSPLQPPRSVPLRSTLMATISPRPSRATCWRACATIGGWRSRAWCWPAMITVIRCRAG